MDREPWRREALWKNREKLAAGLSSLGITIENSETPIIPLVLGDAEKTARTLPVYTFKTDLTVARIQDSFSSPSTVSFWELPRFIASLEATGFSALSHRLHWHSLLAEPLLYCAMILIAVLPSARTT